MTGPAAHVGSVPETPRHQVGRGRAAWLGAAALVLVKLVKSAKFVKFALFVASLGALALGRPLEAACVILYAIFVHETGHVLAMKASGMRTSGMYFLPFLGAVAVGKEPARTRAQEWFIAIAGPAFGLLSLAPLLAIAYATGDPRWDAYAAIAALINLFNLLPIGILDGGRIVQAIAFSIAGWLGIVSFGAGLGLGAYVLMHMAGGVVSLVLVLSLLEFASAWRRNRDNPIPRMRWPGAIGATAAYLALLAVFAFAQEDLVAAAKHFAASPATAMPGQASMAPQSSEPSIERSASLPETGPPQPTSAATDAARAGAAPAAAATPVAELPPPSQPMASTERAASDVATTAPAPPAPVFAAAEPPTTRAQGYRLQLGATRTPESAKQEWDRLQHQHGDVLAKLAYAAPRVDLGKRGVFYRIQAGPLADAATANRACNELKRRGASCILVKP